MWGRRRRRRRRKGVYWGRGVCMAAAATAASLSRSAGGRAYEEVVVPCAGHGVVCERNRAVGDGGGGLRRCTRLCWPRCWGRGLHGRSCLARGHDCGAATGIWGEVELSVKADGALLRVWGWKATVIAGRPGTSPLGSSAKLLGKLANGPPSLATATDAQSRCEPPPGYANDSYVRRTASRRH